MKIKINRNKATLISMIKEELANIKESNMNRLHVEIQNELELVMEKFGIGLGDLEGVIMDMKAAEPAQDAGFPKISDFGATPEQIAMLPPKGMNEAYGGDGSDFFGGAGRPEWVDRVESILFEAAELIGENGSDPELTDAYLALLRAARDGGLNLKYLMMSV